MSQKDKLGVALQASVGTKKTTMDYWIPVTAASLAPSRDTLAISETAGIRVPLPEDMGSKSYAGSIDGAMRPDSFPAILGAAFGAPTTSTLVAATAWSHVFDPCASGKNPRPLSVFQVYGDPTTPIVDLFYDVYINGLEMSVAQNDYMLFSADCVGLHLDQSQSNPSATNDATSKFTATQVGAQISVDGGSLADVSISDWRLRWNNNIEADPTPLGETEAASATPGSVTIEGSFTVTGANNVSDHYRRALLDTPSAVRLVLTAEGATISGAHKYSVVVDIKRLRYTAAPVAVSGSDALKGVTVDFAAYLDSGTSKAVEITVKNGQDGSKF